MELAVGKSQDSLKTLDSIAWMTNGNSIQLQRQQQQQQLTPATAGKES